MKRTDLLAHLHQRFFQLKQRVEAYDRQLNAETNKALQHQARFHSQLFDYEGASLGQCIAKMQHDLDRLTQLASQDGHGQTFELICQKFSDRYQAVNQAMAATGVQVSGTKLKSRRHYKAKESPYQWIAQSVMNNSNSAYAELRKHQNWAQRLQQKIELSEQKLNSLNGQEKIQLQNDILATHKRLGKCRQAITYIEERIARLERRQYSNNRSNK